MALPLEPSPPPAEPFSPAEQLPLAEQLHSHNLRDRITALIAIKTLPSDQALPLLVSVLEDPNPQIRGMAAYGLGYHRTPQSLDLLVEYLSSDSDYNVRAAAAGALGHLQDPRALDPLSRSFYEDTNWLVRYSATVALGNLQDPRAQTVLLEALASDEPLLQQGAIAALGEIAALGSIQALLQFAASQDWLLRQRLAEALGNLPSTKSRSALAYLSKDSHPQVAAAAILALTRLTPKDAESNPISEC